MAHADAGLEQLHKCSTQASLLQYTIFAARASRRANFNFTCNFTHTHTHVHAHTHVHTHTHTHTHPRKGVAERTKGFEDTRRCGGCRCDVVQVVSCVLHVASCAVLSLHLLSCHKWCMQVFSCVMQVLSCVMHVVFSCVLHKRTHKTQVIRQGHIRQGHIRQGLVSITGDTQDTRHQTRSYETGHQTR